MAEEPWISRKRKKLDNDVNNTNISCPYLDTIQRSLMDFDLEPNCCVSLETGPHIYACLVCGKFFRGRGPGTPAHTHSVEQSHFVYVHLSKGTFYCLPDDYEIIDDTSLDDIRAALHPSFTLDQITLMDQQAELSRDLFGRNYLPGFIGLNNLNKTDYINAVVQALSHVPHLRDYFLRLSYNNAGGTSPSTYVNHKNNKKKGNTTSLQVSNMHRLACHVTSCFGELVRKLWSDHRFKDHVDPHQLVHAIVAASNKRFQVGKQAEVGEFISWLLNQLHIGTGGSKKPGSSIVHSTFQGRVEVTTRQWKANDMSNARNENNDRGGSDAEEDYEVENHPDPQTMEEITDVNQFLLLTLEMPERPLFRDADGGVVIPQEPMSALLKKFDGVSFTDAISRSGAAQRKQYKLRELPLYLILHLARFKTNSYSREKNPTIVAFPVKNLDLSSYVYPDNGPEVIPSKEQVESMSIKELKHLLRKYNRADIAHSAIEKSELVQSVLDFVLSSLPEVLMDKYDLVANVAHDSPADVGREGKHDPLAEGSYKCHVQHRATKQWYEIQDLHVQEVMPQQIGLSETCLLIFERKSAQLRKHVVMMR